MNEIQPVIAQMLRYKLGRKSATDLVERFGSERCIKQISNLEAKLALSESGTIKDPAAWLVSAIRDDYGQSTAAEEEGAHEQKDTSKVVKSVRKKYNSEWQDFRANRGEAKYKNLSRKALDEYQRAFIELITTTAEDQRIRGVKSSLSMLKFVVENDGHQAPLIDVELRNWLKLKLLDQPEELDLECFVAWRGYDDASISSPEGND